jgi:3-hydroxyacyl-CoA dehydrogenase
MLKHAGYEVIHTSDNPGYIGNYVLFHEISAALKLVEHGYGTAEIDRTLTHLGRTTSIFDVIDLIGVDVTLSILQSLGASDPAFRAAPLLERAIRDGVLGTKNGTSIRALIDRRSDTSLRADES